MSESEKKDKILAFFDNDDNKLGFYSSNDLRSLIFKDVSVSELEMRFMIESIIEHGYLIGTAARCRYNHKLTPFRKSGGYAGEEVRRISEEEHQARVKQNTKRSGRLAKWQIITFWIIFIGTILSIIAFFRK